MELLTLPQWLALAGIVCSAGIFISHAVATRREKLSVDDYLLANQSVSGSAFTNTFAASNFSLSTNIIFFVSSYALYGWLMTIGPMFMLASQLLLLKWLDKVKLQPTECRTAADVWYTVFPSRKIARCIASLCAATCFMGLFIELYMGSVLASLFVPDAPLFQISTFFILGLLTLAYVRFGGLRTIVQTDTWQFWMVIASCVGMTLLSLYAPITNGISWQSIVSQLGHYEASGFPLWSFMLWVCAMNICLSVTYVSAWQRMHAAQSKQEAFKSLLYGGWKYLFIIAMPIMACVILGLKGYEYSTIGEFLQIVQNQSGQLAWLLFPIIIVGFSSALFSTADTYMIAALYAICDQNTLGEKLNTLDVEQQHKTMNKYLSAFSLCLLVLLTAFYYIQHAEIAKFIMPVIYAVYGQIAVVAPLIFYAIYHLYHDKDVIVFSEGRENFLLAMLMFAWLVLIVGSVCEAFYGHPAFSQGAFLVALVAVLIGLGNATSSAMKRPTRSALA